MVEKNSLILMASMILFFSCLSAAPSYARILDMREMATVDFSGLDLARTVILIPEGILEEHGPFLPSYTDGYQNAYLVRRLAEAIVKREGWSVLIFPPIPLGDGGANQVARRQIFPGTYHVHFPTLRAIFMDLASEFGEAGFQWVFIISEHGAPRHQLALDQAGDFFGDVYGGTMVFLSGLVFDQPAPIELDLSSQEQTANGLDIHAGMSETSAMLFLRPELVRSGYKDAEPLPGTNWRDFLTRGARPEWPGYYGAPGLASAARGALLLEARLAELSDLALRILDGFDAGSLKRLSALQLEDEAIREYNTAADAHALRIQQIQQAWLERRGLGGPPFEQRE